MSVLKKQYSPMEIMQAAQIYFLTGSLTKTAEKTGISANTLQSWKDRGNEFWVQRYKEVQDEKREELDSHYTEIIEKSSAELKDRIEKGDEFYDAKTGKKYRKKISGRDLAIINGTCFDKRQLLRGLPTTGTSSLLPFKERLKLISEELKKHSGRVSKEAQVIEAEVVKNDDSDPK